MKKGFTLAEVLITLGVIGVVAALTMPNLLQNHQKKVFVTQLQRTVNLISNSATALMGDNNAASLADSYLVAVTATDDKGNVTGNYKDAQGKFMNTYFKVARDCGTDNRAACLGDTYYSLDRSKSYNLNDQLQDYYYCVTLNTGATVCMTDMSSDENDGGDIWHGYSGVVIDVNGPSGPNTNGRDLFEFSLFSDGVLGNLYPDSNASSNNYYKKVTSGEICQIAKSEAYYFSGRCFQHIMSNGWVMDY